MSTHDDDAFEGRVGTTWQESTAWWPERRKPPQGPNVIFIVLDDVGFADLGCYGSEIRTPAIDALAGAGLQYNNFHVTSMCSPTRAALLTGRNAHSVGMGFLADFDSGFPGYRGRVSTRAATLAEMLRDHGYSTFAAGKWHLTPAAEISNAGPFRHWPTERGFDRWFGFQGPLTDQWHPDLYEEKRPVPAAELDGRHLSEVLVDRASGWITDQQIAMPGTPFFLYLAFGAAHWPHQAPAEFIDGYRGRYDTGWGRLREERFARQMSLGVVPAGTSLPPVNPGVAGWDSLSAEERKVCARFMEAYAGFVEHTDAQIGRLLGHLEKPGQRDNTLVVLISDNGASPEGGAIGTTNTRKHFLYERDPVGVAAESLSRTGSADTFSHYPIGWAQASNTPLRWYKTDTHGGGVRAPMIVNWPAGIRSHGRRAQFHHVVDITPTILELTGARAPEVYKGIPQLPIHGTSLRYTFDDAAAATRKKSQYFELLGDRGIWQDGWKAVTHHAGGSRFEDDRWELYHLDRDFSECRDLAAQEPARLEQLKQLWLEEAQTYSVLPLDDRLFERIAARLVTAPTEFVYRSGMSRTDRLRVPNIAGRSHRIVAEIDLPAAGAEGVILSAGTRFCGYVLFIRNGRLVHEYAFSPELHFRVEAPAPSAPGRHSIAYVFSKTGPLSGDTVLEIDGAIAGRGAISKTWPVRALNTGMLCGLDSGTPKSADYSIPFAFTGTIHKVTVSLGSDFSGDAHAGYRSYRTSGEED